jgi:hypothetical protein
MLSFLFDSGCLVILPIGEQYSSHVVLPGEEHKNLQMPLVKRNWCFGLFRLIFCLFRFNRNTETRCFGKEAKQPKQTFCFG